MRHVEELPAAFNRYRKIGGVLDFAVFEGTKGTDEEVLKAIPHALQRSKHFNQNKLRSLGYRRIKERKFFGEWYDFDSRQLLKRGSWRTAGGTELQDPTLKVLDQYKIVSGAAPCPEIGLGGQFAYAFSSPPYNLHDRPGKVQELFDAITDFILPPSLQSDIRDWSSPQMLEVSDYFAAGMGWWGVFLFSIHIPAIERLTIIAGSTTD
ncbi:MAG: hypothetical protein JY451_07870 [Erythrobacter sp.]|nr:MAG: hypothetical protein JY451_07870 [Erythrobacter sp.]